jgi:enoyl-[acyl-carrier protein] reductase III
MADLQGWALILGASSGFGAAAGKALAEAGLDIFGVHLDRRATMPVVDAAREAIEAAGRRAIFFNINAADAERRAETLDAMAAQLEEDGRGGGVHVLMHSLAFGTLLPYVATEEGGKVLSQRQVEMTVDVMAHSLVYWSQEVVSRGLMGNGGRIFAMTSSGGTRIIPSYGAVSSAKAALESHIRQLAFELGPRGITANCLRAGVTDTPALRKIPGSERLLSEAARRNPTGRLTTPEDVAGAIVALSGPGAGFISGNVIGVDGGEDIVG